MSYAAMTTEESIGAATRAEVSIPADIGWEMLDKSRFFVLGAALFSAVSAALHPAVVLKTRLQVASSTTSLPCLRTAKSILCREGPRGFYRGFGTSLTGTIPARALYMAALEVTRSGVGSSAARLGVPEATAAAVANAAAGVSSAVAAQVVWTPIDVVSQRLMVQQQLPAAQAMASAGARCAYRGGVDAFQKIFRADGLRGLYRGFGVSLLTYAPSNAVWWSTYSLTQRLIWAGLLRRRDPDVAPGGKTIVAVQGISAATAGGLSALVTMPLDTIKTRMQVLDDGGKGCSFNGSGLVGAVKTLAREGGGWRACYRGLGPRWASTSLSAATMVTTYEFLKRKSAKGAGDYEEF